MSLLLCMTFLLSGCMGFSEKDAKEYTQGVLDAGYKGEYTLYRKTTKSTQEEAEKVYENTLQSCVDGMGMAAGDGMISEETEKTVKDMFGNLLSKARYQVKEVEKNDKSFKVTVAVKPLQISINALSEEVYDEIMNDETIMDENVTEKEFYDRIYKGLADKINAILENPEYGDEVEHIVTIVRNDKVYEIPKKELEALEIKMFNFN